MASSLDRIEDVNFDGEGSDEYRAKYVLIEIKGPEGVKKIIARARRTAGYHREVYEPVKSLLETQGVSAEVCGGGRGG